MRSSARTVWIRMSLDRAGQIPVLERFVRKVEPEPRWKRASRRALPFVATGGASGVAVYLFDPDRGRARRARMRDQVLGTARRSKQRARRSARKLGSDVRGWRRRHEPRTPKSGQPNDATLTHKVESEVLGHVGVDKGRLNVNAEEGVIVLRGEVDTSKDVERLVARIRKVPGVRDVRTLLHLKNQPAPSKRPSIEASQRAMSAARRGG